MTRRYESQGLGLKTIDAQKLWFAIVESQIETGTPYMLYKVGVEVNRGSVCLQCLTLVRHTGCLQHQVQPEEPWHHQELQSLH